MAWPWQLWAVAHISNWEGPALAVGADGIKLVFQTWSYMVDDTNHLPKPKDEGCAFAPPFGAFYNEFAPTFPELRPILFHASCRFQKGQGLCWRPGSHAWPRLESPYQWHIQTGPNPMAFDISNVTSCTQTTAEPVDAFAILGGMPRPTDTTNMTACLLLLTRYAPIHLCNDKNLLTLCTQTQKRIT